MAEGRTTCDEKAQSSPRYWISSGWTSTYFCPISIKQRPGNHANKELEKHAQGANPRYLGRRLAQQLVGEVVLLKGAEGVGEAESAKEDGRATSCGEPSACTAFWC